MVSLCELISCLLISLFSCHVHLAFYMTVSSFSMSVFLFVVCMPLCKCSYMSTVCSCKLVIVLIVCICHYFSVVVIYLSYIM